MYYLSKTPSRFEQTQMNERSNMNMPSFSIAAVERDTGLGKDTLRVWEKRYGFPVPDRDEHGERLYPIEQVEKLRVIKRLIDNGHRPGKIISLSIEELQILAESNCAGALISVPADAVDQLRNHMELIKNHQDEEFKQLMSRQVLSKGLRKFVVDVVAPLNTMVGEAWARGYFEVFEEHLYTETVQKVLRNSISTLAPSTSRPKVLLTTLPNEPHGLGLLMVECMFALEGAQVVSLGTQTPVYDIAKAALAHKVDLIALSFSSMQSSGVVLDSLEELRSSLPEAIEIWCGGSSTVIRRRSASGFTLLEGLDEIVDQLALWRKRNCEK